ncbi:dihydrofolate reductase family protein [bacterium]|nr:dihydrofolate reductase family protein [bacterium]
MRKIIYYVASSLDGFIAGPEGEIDWLFSDQDYGFSEFYNSIDTIISGRITFDVGLAFEEKPFGDKEVHVFTRDTNKETLGYINYISEDPVEFTRSLLKQPGGDIWLLGGGKLAGLLVGNKLVDEYIVSIHPTLLGEGIPLNPFDYHPVDLELVDVKSFDSGLVQLHYKIK